MPIVLRGRVIEVDQDHARGLLSFESKDRLEIQVTVRIDLLVVRAK